MRLSESYYWDLNDRTRSFQTHIQPKVTLWPSMAQAGNYSATLHYLKIVQAMGPAAAKADGAATVAQMKKMPTDDDCFGPGRIREDGRKIHPVYLFEVKKPSESKQPWDLYKLIGTTPAEEAFRPLSEGACPLVKDVTGFSDRRARSASSCATSKARCGIGLRSEGSALGSIPTNSR